MTAGAARALALGLLASFAAGDPGDDELERLRRDWVKLKRPARVAGLMRLGARPSPAILKQCRTWLKGKDVVVRGHVLRLAAGCRVDPKLRAAAETLVRRYVHAHLDARARREKQEFAETCRRFGRTIPPAGRITAGSDWKDPYDEESRRLPEEIKAERLHMREVIAALQGEKTAAFRTLVARIFEEHHDPEVVVRAVECFRAWREWHALPAMADLARIQQHGRLIGGSDAGNVNYDIQRLKWDVHKDRLWWSRPEYVPRVVRPICAAASELTGTKITSARELDRWLLDNGARLRRDGVTLPKDFRGRARSSQR